MNNEEKPQKKHPILKALLIILLVFIAVVGIGAIYLFSRYKKYSVELQEAQKGVIGTEAPDFTVQTTEGEELTLSKVLEEKEVVVLNIFTTWCGPCEIEFPEFESTYQKYKDKMEIISLSGDSDETMEDVAVLPTISELSRIGSSGSKSATHRRVSIADKSTRSPAPISRVATHTSTCSPP